MATTTHTADNNWQQITNGSQTAMIQVISGVIRLHDSKTKPADDAVGHPLTGFVNISPPVSAWVKGYGRGAVIIVTSN